LGIQLLVFFQDFIRKKEKKHFFFAFLFVLIADPTPARNLPSRYPFFPRAVQAEFNYSPGIEPAFEAGGLTRWPTEPSLSSLPLSFLTPFWYFWSWRRGACDRIMVPFLPEQSVVVIVAVRKKVASDGEVACLTHAS
jgi:hypothetical protein